ncbi:UNVERIFIED_CONTAM: hypothetical protein Sindi_2955500 [Sesamum indicum]
MDPNATSPRYRDYSYRSKRKRHYIVQDWRLTHSVTLHWTFPKRIGSGQFNNRRLLAFHPSFSFQAYPKENPVLLGREYLNWLFAVQEFLFGQFIPSIHSVLI